MRNVNNHQAELFFASHCTLGEGPIWDETTKSLHWVDILEKTVHTLDTTNATHRTTVYPETLGCIGLTNRGNWLLGMKDTLRIFEPGSTSGHVLFHAPTMHPANRFNDGKPAPDGSFVVGTMDMNEKEANGQLYQVAPTSQGTAQVLLPAVTISNGLAWDVQKKVMYYIDTPTKTIQRATYDPTNGKVGPLTPFITVSESLGYPDGMTIDAHGDLYVAMWQGSAVTIWSGDDGSQIGSIKVPALNVTCPVFGGENLDELFITSARVGMTPEQLNKYPLAGGVFKVMLDVKGLPGYRYREA